MSTKKVSNPAPGTQAVEAAALDQVGAEEAQIGEQATAVGVDVDTPTPVTPTVEGTAAAEVSEATSAEDKTDNVQLTIQSLKASVESLTSQLQETRQLLEAKERAEQRAIRLEKAGIPKTLSSFIRDDADLESLSDVLSGLTAPAAGGMVRSTPTPTLPTVGSKNPGGEVLSIDEMISRAEANNDYAALSSLKLAKLSAASNKF